MLKRTSYSIFCSAALLLGLAAGCKKGTFDINSPNPNNPSSVDPKFVLSASLVNSASTQFSANLDPMQFYMGYWAYSGDYGVSSNALTYNTINSSNNNNWDNVYENMANYKLIQSESTDPSYAYYGGISTIMLAWHFSRIVDMYNNIPFTAALQGGTINYPTYTDGATIYTTCIHWLDSAVALINGAPVTANNPETYDVMFGGTMSNWVLFANTVKLKLLLHLTQWSGGAALIQSELNGMTTADFLPAGTDAGINPGYSNSSNGLQNPMWQNVGFNTSNSPYQGYQLDRACSYAVAFYQGTNDPRDSLFYAVNSADVVKGRAFGSTNSGAEHNAVISAVGPGILKAPSMTAYMIPAFESLFLQAEAAQRGYITGATPVALFNSAVSESFRLLGVPSYATAAAAYTSQTDIRTNLATSSNPIETIILQKWAANNMFDPLESWDDWRRLGYPSDLPVSVYPGTTATHIPYRILYPLSEANYNQANMSAQGTINILTSKIFWQP
ncbi:MAG TPA: SusD/RagB family nutrient-binding outer membrane lipoprotein [Dinghuibacter sp.]|uniref:SusD/RagB family nutrient-binding outer membrane lipoprotein n=1 Tax=Dinghuibacter sp. TaxID=2024697 RepID=UPI002C2BE627|nr:SusD/RagB family nutrient-binding outer membrane lipoprotein [Dinghuibacter sp.]HTJ12668.1 SusD/RagB family nutrient-binding outer membrane lipoprotein [Dinghuibacter sp.]